MATARMYGPGADSSTCSGLAGGGGTVDPREEPDLPPDRAAAARSSNPGWPVGWALNIGTESESGPTYKRACGNLDCGRAWVKGLANVPVPDAQMITMN